MDSVGKHHEYIENFHNLGGHTSSEHHKNFHLYLKDLENVPIHIINALITNLQPRYTQEEIFRARLLIKFNRHAEILELVKERKGLNKIVTRSPAFIAYIIQLQPKHFITKICPLVSFVTRCHLVNKMSAALKDEAAGDAYYDTFAAVYGHKNASPFLISCTEAKLRQVITENNHKLNENQLVELHEKYPTFLKFYFEEQSKSRENPFETCKSLPKYLSIKDISTFKELLVFGKPGIGRKGLANYIKAYKMDVISKPREYNTMLIPRTVYKILSREDFLTFLKNIFPKRIEECNSSEIQPYLQLLPFKARGDVLATTYESAYGCSVYNNESIKDGMLELLSHEYREKFNLAEDQIEYRSSSVAVCSLKNSIAFTSDQANRKTLIEKLINTCKHNRDSEAFLDVLKYYCSHHKNDAALIGETFMRVITECIQVLKLTEEHWKCLEDIILTSEVNGEQLPYNCYFLFEQRVQFKILNKMDYTDVLKMYLKNRNCWDMLSKYPKYHRMCMLQMQELISEIYEEGDKRKKVHVEFLLAVYYWNHKYKAKINFYDFPEYIQSLYELVKGGWDWCEHVIDDIIRSKVNPEYIELRDKLIEIQFETNARNYGRLLCMRLLKESHPALKTHVGIILDVEKYNLNHKFYYEVSKMHYTGLADYYRSKAFEILNNPDSKTTLLKGALTYLSFGDDFLDIIEKYKPKQYEINLHESNMKQNLIAQKTILACIKNYPKSIKCIQTVLEYCRKDYLQYALRSYNNVFYNIPQHIIQPILEKASLDDNAEFAVTKFVVCTSTYLCPIEFSKEVLKQCTKSPNTFMQKHAIKQMFNLFISDPTDFNRDFLLHSHFDKINGNDKETISMLCEIQKIPTRHQPIYIKTLWNLPCLKEENRFELLKSIRLDVLQLLDSDLWDGMVRMATAKVDENIPECDMFVRKYLVESVDKMSARFSHVFAEGTYRNDIKRAYNLITDICRDFIKEKGKYVAVSAELLKNVDGLKLDHDTTPLKIMAACTNLYISHENPREVLASHFVDQLKKYEQYAFVYSYHFKTFLEILDDYGGNHELMCAYARAVMEVTDCTAVRVFALSLLRDEVKYNVPYNAKRKDVIELIRKDADPVIETYLSSRLCAKFM